MAPQKRRVELAPSELTLDLGASAAPIVTLTISNHSDEHLAFKVRTTQPKRYLVKPNQDILPAMGSVTVAIQMQAREAAAVLEQGFDEAGKDKFMISSRVVDDAFMKSVKSAKDSGSKELQQLFTNLWDNTPKDDIASRRVACNFIQSSGTQRPSTAVPVSPAPSASAPSASTEAASAAKPPSSAKAAPSPSPALASTAQPQASPPSLATVAAAQIQTPNKKAEEVLDKIETGTHASSSKSLARGSDPEFANFETLSKQYKETLATLVQVTEERDRFQAKFRELTREMTQLKEETRASRKGGMLDSDMDRPATVAKTGYPFWHLIIVAMVSFMVARILQMSKNDLLSF